MLDGIGNAALVTRGGHLHASPYETGHLHTDAASGATRPVTRFHAPKPDERFPNGARERGAERIQRGGRGEELEVFAGGA